MTSEAETCMFLASLMWSKVCIEIIDAVILIKLYLPVQYTVRSASWSALPLTLLFFRTSFVQSFRICNYIGVTGPLTSISTASHVCVDA